MILPTARPQFFPWIKSETSIGKYARELSGQEQTLSWLNDQVSGQNCPYLGATISVQHEAISSSPLDVEALESRLSKAFVETRFCYPAIACQVKDASHMVYNVEPADKVAQWADRTVKTVISAAGWLELREKLSVDAVLPSDDGDCAFLYLIIDPEQASKTLIDRFDLLLHVHHGLTDGAGLRSILNSVLRSLATAETVDPPVWGEEVIRLNPAALDVAKISPPMIEQLAKMPKVPSPPSSESVRGTSRSRTAVVSHTFSRDFLSKLLTTMRANEVKLTGAVQSAIVLALYDQLKEEKSDVKEDCTVVSAFDLRSNNLDEKSSQPNAYAGVAVGLEMMPIANDLLSKGSDRSQTDRFLAVAREIQRKWVTASQREDVAAIGEMRRAGASHIVKFVSSKAQNEALGLSMNVAYVSDPAGSQQLSTEYGKEGADNHQFSLDHYQISTEERTSELSCRSHSWKDELTLCISYNSTRHPVERINSILTRWINTLKAEVDMP